MNEFDQYETRARTALACLGVASRFRLVRALAAAERCVGELAEVVGLSQSCTTRHLQALERVGLVKGHREGRRVRFRLRAETPGLRELLVWALSESECEASAAGGTHPVNQFATALTGLAGRPAPTKAGRREQPTGATRPQDKAVHAPMVEPEPRFRSGPHDLEEAGPQAFAGPRPARRPNDLEDYLL